MKPIDDNKNEPPLKLSGRSGVRTLSRRRWLGPLLYLSSAQYFLVQVIVGALWNPSYSWKNNAISDLGNTVCGTFNSRPVCSPAHDLMNLSFVVLGATMLIGSLLVKKSDEVRRWASIGFRCMEIAGAGVDLVGLFPENTVSVVHGLGAGLAFVLGNIGIIVLGVTLRIPRVLRVFSVLAGTVALTALVAFARSHNIGLGEGGIERVVAYPQTIWLIVMGTYLLRSHRSNHPRRLETSP